MKQSMTIALSSLSIGALSARVSEAGAPDENTQSAVMPAGCEAISHKPMTARKD